MVTFIELAFASACASVCAPTISETATSGAAEQLQCGASEIHTELVGYRAQPVALGKMLLRNVPIVLAIIVARTARMNPALRDEPTTKLTPR